MIISIQWYLNFSYVRLLDEALSEPLVLTSPNSKSISDLQDTEYVDGQRRIIRTISVTVVVNNNCYTAENGGPEKIELPR